MIVTISAPFCPVQAPLVKPRRARKCPRCPRLHLGGLPQHLRRPFQRPNVHLTLRANGPPAASAARPTASSDSAVAAYPLPARRPRGMAAYRCLPRHCIAGRRPQRGRRSIRAVCAVRLRPGHAARPHAPPLCRSNGAVRRHAAACRPRAPSVGSICPASRPAAREPGRSRCGTPSVGSIRPASPSPCGAPAR